MTTRSGDEKEEMKRNVKESKTTRSKREEQHSIYSARIQEEKRETDIGGNAIKILVSTVEEVGSFK